MNMQTGEIRPWDSLSAEEQTSGNWIKLPPRDSDGHVLARPRTVVDSLNLPRANFDALRRLFQPTAND